MKKLIVEIEVTNAAFEGALMQECSRILRTLANQLDYWPGDADCQLYDSNGNNVGQAEFLP